MILKKKLVRNLHKVSKIIHRNNSYKGQKYRRHGFSINHFYK